MKTYYTAVGRFEKRYGAGGVSCPIIFVGQREYALDLQEMMLWTILSWRILEPQQIEEHYRLKVLAVGYDQKRSWEDCLRRLQQRGLVVTGSGDCGEDALYSLLSCLYVIPISNSLLLQLAVYLKLTIFKGTAHKIAKRVFQRTAMTDCEKQVYRLVKQAPLSTAELIKCIERRAEDLSTGEKLMDALYDDEDTTSDNIAGLVRCLASRQPVLLAVANLYLSQQIIFERGEGV